MAPAPLRLGLTATYPEEHEQTNGRWRVDDLIGPIVYTKRIEEHIKGKKLEVLFNSMPTEFRKGSVVLDIGGTTKEVPNEYVWIFAGGIPPTEFLKSTGIGFGAMDVSTRTE